MALDREQRHVLGELIRHANERKLPKHWRDLLVKAGVETGLVEQNLHNRPGGSGSSQGWRQEISSYGSVANRLNLSKSIERFYNEALPVIRGNPGIVSGELAARVQRPAAQYRGRYAARSREASGLLRGMGYTGHGQGVRNVLGGGRSRAVARTPAQPAGPGVAALLAQLQQPRVQPASSQLQAPAFSAQAALPKGYQSVETGPPPVKDTTVQDVLGQISSLQGPTVAHSAPAAGGGGAARRPAPLGHGHVTLDPGADRAGVPTDRGLIRFLHRVSAIQHIPIEVGTGSNHNRMTTSGNVSDHWTGHATDLLVGGDARQSAAARRRGDTIAGGIFRALGYSRSEARRMAQRGGVFSITKHGTRYQILWKTLTGGDHFNHVHVGIRRG